MSRTRCELFQLERLSSGVPRRKAVTHGSAGRTWSDWGGEL
jgi:hypothetical protein